jgi:hypothetical protein
LHKSARLFGILIVIILLFTCFFSQLPFIIISASSDASDSFSVVQITDTQYLSRSFPELFDNLTTWIVNNVGIYNIKMVIHTGDIVDDWNSSDQWINANRSMSILLDNEVPYCWDAGNHDQINSDPSSSWIGSNYLAFNASYMATKSYWVASSYDSKNTAVQFSFRSYNFLIINLEYLANSSVIAWMKNLLNNNSGSNIILATHDYLNSTNGYGFHENPPVWENELKANLNDYPNIFLTLNGHDYTGGANTTRINGRQEIFFNRQSIDSWKGSASARIYTFNMANLQVSVSTYLVYNDSYVADSYSQFTFDVSTLISTLNVPTTIISTTIINPEVTMPPVEKNPTPHPVTVIPSNISTPSIVVGQPTSDDTPNELTDYMLQGTIFLILIFLLLFTLLFLFLKKRGQSLNLPVQRRKL